VELSLGGFCIDTSAGSLMYFTQFMAAAKIGPALATGNTIVLKVKLSLHLPKFLEIHF
jgi:hypothetical protein